jgi:hypothetical protein
MAGGRKVKWMKRLILLVLLLCACGGLARASAISDVKLLPNGGYREVYFDAIVTYSAANYFYIQQENGTCGIRVDIAGHGMYPGTLVSLRGYAYTKPDNLERYLAGC